MKHIRFTLASLLFASLAFLTPASAAIDLDAIKPNGFARGVVFTVDGYEANRPPLTNFPVLVRISETGISDFDYEDVYSHTDNGKTVPHLAFTDAEGNALAFDVDTWSNSSTSLVWATLPVMTNGAEFAMFWRATEAAANAATGGNAFTNYVGVWHLGETENGQQTINDASPNDLAATSSDQSSPKLDGMVGVARQITDRREKKDKGIKVQTTKGTEIASLNRLGTNFSVSFWMRPRGAVTTEDAGIRYDVLIGRKNATTTKTWHLQLHDASTNLRIWSYEKDTNGLVIEPNVLPLVQYEWTKVDVVYHTSGTKYSVYTNGAHAASGNFASGHTVQQVDQTLTIGGGFNGGERPFWGDMDEVRVGPFTASENWVKADYDQVANADFLSASSVTSFAEAANPVATFSLDDWGAAYAQFSGSISVCGGSATACSVYARAYPTDGMVPAWTLLTNGVPAKGSFSGVLVDLLPQTAYTYEIKAVNNLAEPLDSVVVTGTFTTSGAGEIGSGGEAKRDGDCIVHTFKIARDGTDMFEFVPPSYATTVEALVVAGGGPGGYYAGGGGGAGGLVYNAAFPVTGGETYAITIGAGGAAASSETAHGAKGGNSFITSNGGAVTNLLAIGGGAGGNGELNGNAEAVRVGAGGGSGGGGAGSSTKDKVYAGGAGTNGRGNSGGAGLAEKLVGGGGGGAGAAGSSVSGGFTVSGGNGGDGIEYNISGTPIFYAGGGGGGGKGNKNGNSYGSAGSGGQGGGGNGGMSIENTPGAEACTTGAAHTGGGGGGGSTITGYMQGGNGGSGIVILRYAVQGNGQGMTTPAVALESLDRNETTGLTTVGYRVAWAGDTYDYADVLIVWGFAKNNLSHTNALPSATGVIGRGTDTFTLPDQTKTVYIRALATNAVAGALSPEIVTIPFIDPDAPEATVSATPGITNAGFEANVTSLGGTGANHVEGVFQVCDDTDFEEGSYMTFAVTNGPLTEIGVLKGAATGLSANTIYYVRASLTNNLDSVLETDPVEFRTNPVGYPHGRFVPSNDNPTFTVTTDSISAEFSFRGLGEGATSGSAWMQVSETSNFATILASSEVTNVVAADIPATCNFTVAGLQPDTAYYVRYRVRNNGGRETSNDKQWSFTTQSTAPAGVMFLIY